MKTLCSTCRFWECIGEHADGHKQGKCRRYPPSIIESRLLKHGPDVDPWDVLDATQFSVTFSADWCGEYQPKLPAIAGRVSDNPHLTEMGRVTALRVEARIAEDAYLKALNALPDDIKAKLLDKES